MAFIKDCTFAGCGKPIVLGNSDVLVESSRIEIHGDGAVDLFSASSLIARDTRFAGYEAYELLGTGDKSRLFLDRCRLEYIQGDQYPTTSILAANESSIQCTRSFFHGSSAALLVADSHSEAVLDACVISTSRDIAMVMNNADLTISGCVVDAEAALLALSNNYKGRVQFVNNRISPSTPRVIQIDKLSKKPSHDVSGVVFENKDFDHIVVSQFFFSRQERSRYTKSKKKSAQRLGESFDHNSVEPFLYKKCMKCYKLEDDAALRSWQRGQDAVAKEKFRYCGGCQSAVYCSKECRDAHWVDHRLMCKTKRSN